jgi:hypothetical protein
MDAASPSMAQAQATIVGASSARRSISAIPRVRSTSKAGLSLRTVGMEDRSEYRYSWYFLGVIVKVLDLVLK